MTALAEQAMRGRCCSSHGPSAGSPAPQRQRLTPSIRSSRQRPRLTEGVRDLGEGTQSIHTLAWRRPPHPSISSNPPLPSTFPITILVPPFLTPAWKARSVEGQSLRMPANFPALSVKDMSRC